MKCTRAASLQDVEKRTTHNFHPHRMCRAGNLMRTRPATGSITALIALSMSRVLLCCRAIGKFAKSDVKVVQLTVVTDATARTIKFASHLRPKLGLMVGMFAALAIINS